MAEDQDNMSAAAVTGVDLVADIVSAYVSRNSIRPSDLPELIATVHTALDNLGKPAEAPAENHRATPAQIKKSMTPDALISFLDGKPYKSLKRHPTKHGLTPEEYRAKYGLPQTYPMVAESYAKQRSELAKSLGLGQIRRGKTTPKAVAADATVTGPAKRGRTKKTTTAE